MEIRIKKLNPEAVMPKYAHPGEDVGMDLVAVSCTYNEEKDCYVYGTGLAFEVPAGHAMLIFPRSSNRNTDCYLPNSVGIVDPGYRGEVMVSLKSRVASRVVKAVNNLIDVEQENISNIEDRLQGWYETPDEENIIELNAPYKVGDRIAQFFIIPFPELQLIESDELSDSARGTGGHGSTGH